MIKYFARNKEAFTALSGFVQAAALLLAGVFALYRYGLEDARPLYQGSISSAACRIGFDEVSGRESDSLVCSTPGRSQIVIQSNVEYTNESRRRQRLDFLCVQLYEWSPWRDLTPRASIPNGSGANHWDPALPGLSFAPSSVGAALSQAPLLSHQTISIDAVIGEGTEVELVANWFIGGMTVDRNFAIRSMLIRYPRWRHWLAQDLLASADEECRTMSVADASAKHWPVTEFTLVDLDSSSNVNERLHSPHDDVDTPLSVLEGYSCCPGRIRSVAWPPASVSTPAWIAAGHTAESSEYVPVPQTMPPDEQPAGQDTVQVVPASPANPWALA